jgi:hypothetical protein
LWAPWFIVLIALIVIAIATGAGGQDGGGGGGGTAGEAARELTPVEEIARRVERIRGVRFDEPPEPRRVTPEEAREEGLEAFDRDYRPARRRADIATYALLGLVPDDTDLREIVGSVFDEQVAGYYDPKDGRLRVVEGPGLENPASAEIILAHELTHALEDQVFRLRLDDATGGDDAALAYLALVEGTATALMFEYASQHLSGEELLSGLLASAFAPPLDIPPFLQAQLLFPYEAGHAFAQEVHRAAGGRWTLLDAALRLRPPVSTEQVLHPDKYLAFEEPERVRVRARAALGEGWRRIAAGSLGEWQTMQLLRRAGVAGARDAAAGWGGDRYETWSGPAGEALVVRWRWDTAADRREFLVRLREYATTGAAGGHAAVRHRGGTVSLAIAGNAGLAGRLARAPG